MNREHRDVVVGCGGLGSAAFANMQTSLDIQWGDADDLPLATDFDNVEAARGLAPGGRTNAGRCSLLT